MSSPHGLYTMQMPAVELMRECCSEADSMNNLYGRRLAGADSIRLGSHLRRYIAAPSAGQQGRIAEVGNAAKARTQGKGAGAQVRCCRTCKLAPMPYLAPLIACWLANPMQAYLQQRPVAIKAANVCSTNTILNLRCV